MNLNHRIHSTNSAQEIDQHSKRNQSIQNYNNFTNNTTVQIKWDL